jgi:hypothetical protein
MPVYHRSRLIHIHIPRTGGSAIERFFHSIGDMEWAKESWIGEGYLHQRWYEYQHLSISELFGLTGEFRNFHSFAVIRNPYSRLVSEFYWRRSLSEQKNASLRPFESLEDLVSAIPLEVDTHWRDCVEGANRAQSNFLIHVRPQHHYVCTSTGFQVVKDLLRFERLNEDFNELLGRYGLHADTIRNRPEKNFGEYFSRETLDLVNLLYARDFSLGGYEML